MTPELVCQCIEQKLSSHTCDKCGRPRLDVYDELAILLAWKKGAEIVFDDLGVTYTAIESVHEKLEQT